MLLVVIEPGTPDGFACIREIRDVLVGEGAEIVAPCPHANECPMSSPKWCHFSVRLNRSGLHRRVKDAELPYEDERFSYIAFTRVASDRADGRVVGHPRRPPKRVELEVCARDGLLAVVVPRSSDAYRDAKRLEWGDAVPPQMFAGRTRSRPIT
jgi:ribosomal protein RSM22 (predicted rRNA methylase)